MKEPEDVANPKLRIRWETQKRLRKVTNKSLRKFTKLRERSNSLTREQRDSYFVTTKALEKLLQDLDKEE